MIGWIIRKRLDAAEKKLGASVEYLRQMARAARPAFFRFVKAMPLAEYRRKLPADAWHVARLAAVQQEDCGECVQIEVNLARRDGVAPETLRAALDGNLAALGERLANVHRFATAVATRSGEEETLRPPLQQEFGEEGLIELALAIASCRLFPTVKRAMGYARSCSVVKVEL